MRLFLGILVGILTLGAVACGSSAPDADRATATFVQCLERNGVEAQDVQVTLNTDGSVAGIEAVILGEAGAPYEPSVRLACTDEVEGRSP